MFQFYDSPIKRHDPNDTICIDSTFQFYDSPIKSTLVVGGNEIKSGFNSMIVRLKESIIIQPRPLSLFQFYDSPIKSLYMKMTIILLRRVSIL